MEKVKLAVLFGGRACEHDVSIVHALQAMQAIDRAQYDIIPVYIARDGAWYTGEPLRSLPFLRAFKPETDGVQRVYPDVTSGSGALMAIARKKGLFRGADALIVAARIDAALLVLHGMNGEDGALQGLLELMNIPYTSSGLVGSSVGMDKIAMRSLFRGCGFPVLEAVWFDRDAWKADSIGCVEKIEKTLAYPVFVKPANLGSSIGISRAGDEASLRDSIAVALSYDRRVIVEKGLDNPVEINCSVLGFGEEVTPSVLEMPVRWEEFLTFDEKYLRGGKGSKKGSAKAGGMESLNRRIPAPISDEMTRRIQRMSAEIFRILDCKGVVRIDFMIDKDALYVGEINTIPGALSFYLWEASGVAFHELIDKMVAYAFKAHSEKNESVFAYDSDILQQVSLGGAKGAKRQPHRET